MKAREGRAGGEETELEELLLHVSGTNVGRADDVMRVVMCGERDRHRCDRRDETNALACSDQ